MRMFKCKEHRNKKNQLNIMVEDVDPHTTACTIKMTARVIMHMSGVKNVQDKVGPLEDSAGNIISQGF